MMCERAMAVERNTNIKSIEIEFLTYYLSQ